MIIVMSANATASDICQVTDLVTQTGNDFHLSEGKERTIIGVIGSENFPVPERLLQMKGVIDVVRVSTPYKLASREFHPNDTLIPLNGITVGSSNLTIIAGPCAVESRTQLLEIAHAVREGGATALRGGAFKPRTSPYSFQGLGEQGLQLLAEAREVTGLPIVTEVMDPGLVPLVCKYADVLQIGSRNMQNFPLLRAVGESKHPVLLKRGLCNTLEEWLMAAEYILSQKNQQVIMCERGIRTFENYARNTFDVSALPILKNKSHLPVIADPSHAVGMSEYVESLALAAIAAGADGIIVEVHNDPYRAKSDGRQSLTPTQFSCLVHKLEALAPILNRNVSKMKPSVLNHLCQNYA